MFYMIAGSTSEREAEPMTYCGKRAVSRQRDSGQRILESRRNLNYDDNNNETNENENHNGNDNEDDNEDDSEDKNEHIKHDDDSH